MKPAKILVFVPNWVGDAAMATPTLAALRRNYPEAQICAVARPYVRDVFLGSPDVDEVRGLESLKRGGGVAAFVRDALRVRREGFDTAVLMTNSFRTAIFARLAGAKRRLGYAREARGFLLTSALRPLRISGRYAPEPMIDYYLALADALDIVTGRAGADSTPPPHTPQTRAMRITVTLKDKASAASLFAGFEVDTSKPFAVINPGAAFGAAKCWPAASFAEVARHFAGSGYEVLIVTAPRERDIADEIARVAHAKIKPVWKGDIPLGTLKGVIARAKILITNDSGPRHFGAALGIPTVTIIGPTDPVWSDTGYRGEAILREEVICAPCMLRVCPRDHSCMTAITPEKVIAAAEKLLASPAPAK